MEALAPGVEDSEVVAIVLLPQTSDECQHTEVGGVGILVAVDIKRQEICDTESRETGYGFVLFNELVERFIEAEVARKTVGFVLRSGEGGEIRYVATVGHTTKRSLNIVIVAMGGLGVPSNVSQVSSSAFTDGRQHWTGENSEYAAWNGEPVIGAQRSLTSIVGLSESCLSSFMSAVGTWIRATDFKNPNTLRETRGVESYRVVKRFYDCCGE